MATGPRKESPQAGGLAHGLRGVSTNIAFLNGLKTIAGTIKDDGEEGECLINQEYLGHEKI